MSLLQNGAAGLVKWCSLTCFLMKALFRIYCIEHSNDYYLFVAGLSAGMLVAMPISGFLSVYGFSGGWPSVFYFFGTFHFYHCISDIVVD